MPVNDNDSDMLGRVQDDDDDGHLKHTTRWAAVSERKRKRSDGKEGKASGKNDRAISGGAHVRWKTDVGKSMMLSRAGGADHGSKCAGRRDCERKR